MKKERVLNQVGDNCLCICTLEKVVKEVGGKVRYEIFVIRPSNFSHLQYVLRKAESLKLFVF